MVKRVSDRESGEIASAKEIAQRGNLGASLRLSVGFLRFLFCFLPSGARSPPTTNFPTTAGDEWDDVIVPVANQSARCGTTAVQSSSNTIHTALAVRSRPGQRNDHTKSVSDFWRSFGYATGARTDVPVKD